MLYFSLDASPPPPEIGSYTLSSVIISASLALIILHPPELSLLKFYICPHEDCCVFIILLLKLLGVNIIWCSLELCCAYWHSEGQHGKKILSSVGCQTSSG